LNFKLNNLKKPELLSPAGNLEKLKIAIDYGADAVYGGVSHFSLRIRAGKDFSMEDFKEGIEYAHARNRKVYVTINGFPFNSQLKLLENHIAKMRDLKPDAFIVSTPGVLAMARKIAPEMPLHLSTQANVLNSLDARFYYDLGVTRIISAREISLRDLIAIKKDIPKLEIEIFVHGSMCFAYSGRCLISSLQNGRVPNRGSCANDCRFPYILYAENPETGTLLKLEEDEGIGTYIMNAKDLNLASYIKEIIESDAIDSIKIEGRTKSPYYTAITAKTYRKAIDDTIAGKFNPKIYQTELNSTQNRGFTDGYLIHKPFERNDTQNINETMLMGTHQVSGIVLKDGYFFCRFSIFPEEELEIVSLNDNYIDEVQNEIGDIYLRENIWRIKFHKIIREDGTELKSVHSGNPYAIKLPANLPINSFLRAIIKNGESPIPEEANCDNN
jgi:putative protease